MYYTGGSTVFADRDRPYTRFPHPSEGEHPRPPPALSIINFIEGASMRRYVMRGTTPPPMVPVMPTESTETSDREVEADGGEERALPERTFGAPLVPDCS